ncbi:uncharacterized protein LOC131230456 [Magnolia sinica]|uniref:uncharacterized protein LOC131230456 n=1 Tax=Magnolia sinica TaxID=86752 RepID=UPI002659A1C6|nr:uncharacterized protein LOC131230456 [Magnolia sinica]
MRLRHGARGQGARGYGAYGRGTHDTYSTQAHPAPILEDLILEVLIQPLVKPVPPIAPIPPVPPVPPVVPPSKPIALVTKAPAPSTALVPPPEASVAPAFLTNHQPAVPVSEQSDLPRASAIFREFK